MHGWLRERRSIQKKLREIGADEKALSRWKQNNPEILQIIQDVSTSQYNLNANIIRHMTKELSTFIPADSRNVPNEQSRSTEKNKRLSEQADNALRGP